jgi:transcriptional regulator with XRE-family HTH domain
MNGVPDSEAQKAMGARLQAIREALRLTQEDMAATMGVVTTALSAWESGRNQIDIVKLARSATRWGFTTDWVARGDLSGLRRDLADLVEAAMANERVPRRGRPPARPKGPDLPAGTPLRSARRGKPPDRPLAGDGIDRPDEVAWVSFWRGLDDAERDEALRALQISVDDPVRT